MILRARAAGPAGPEAREGPCPCVRHLYNNKDSRYCRRYLDILPT